MIFKHPTAVCMNYFSHMKFSLTLTYHFLSGAYYSFVHAFYPDAYLHNSTETIRTMVFMVENTGCKRRPLPPIRFEKED